ncbi:BON domain-containing protein [Paraburkholderia silviterrae]|uniref:BON domain-containing protein n=1 Tax=Paraburkholderia silviterrae TaxID=2528715 RepID=A0A4R5M2J3_9BURK|nr:BON domain-containing protein [Paraburkholderia silviterrae]TDG19733.1 BON domain-containing protein [Paraburkholderia silviterrae]
MKATYKAVFWVLAGCMSAVALAQGPASEAGAPDGSATSPVASAPGASKKSERTANRLFARKIHQALNKTKGLAGVDIAVFANAQTGEVVLGGFIDTQDQEHIATDAASKVPGVKSVASKIVLRPQL